MEIGTANENHLPPKVVREVVKELRALGTSPSEGIRVNVNEETAIMTVLAEIDGPAGTPYEGGVFRMKLLLGNDYPSTPPKGYFLTRIFHPNIAKNGEICVNVLKKDWKPSLGLRHTLLAIRCLLIEPFPESALNEEAGRMLMEDYEGYARHARLMTTIHAAAAPSAASAQNQRPIHRVGPNKPPPSTTAAAAAEISYAAASASSSMFLPSHTASAAAAGGRCGTERMQLQGRQATASDFLPLQPNTVISNAPSMADTSTDATLDLPLMSMPGGENSSSFMEMGVMDPSSTLAGAGGTTDSKKTRGEGGKEKKEKKKPVDSRKKSLRRL